MHSNIFILINDITPLNLVVWELPKELTRKGIGARGMVGCKERGRLEQRKCRKGDKRYVEDPEETPERRVMFQIWIRSDQIPVRSDLFLFSLKFVIDYFTILLSVLRNCGKYVRIYLLIPNYYLFYCFISRLHSKYPFIRRLCGKYPFSFLLSVFLSIYKPTICLAYKLGIRF
jgi:hypothetical protein